MVTRRSHKKSHTGCAQCKQRKIKCDETRPVCRGCIKREIQCDYMTPSTAQRPSTIINQDNSTRNHASELELMHHYSVWTYKTCAHGETSYSWWQETLPIMAIQHQHLLCALLSFTSLHICHLHPEKADKYMDQAIDYRDRTLNILAAVLPGLPYEQTDASFWSSAIIGLISLAIHRFNPGQALSPTSLLLDLSSLWKGAAAVGALCPASTNVEYLVNSRSESCGAVIPKLQDTEFGMVIKKVIDCLHEEYGIPEKMRIMYVEAVHNLVIVYSAFESKGGSAGILAWFSCLDLQILEAIRSEKVEASLIIIIYGVALNAIRDVWYIHDLGIQLIEELTSKVPLGHKEIIKLINWARERVCT
ncbi:hypothetical protein BX600DRAFT_467965 [Xylariales sp. PMI_506]|nr:hypothetical protein BX600DRAFT_467965 [Xylariales sp. PMI_506]